MKIIRKGFTYELENFDNKIDLGQVVKFIERTREGDITFLIQDGTIVEELIKVAIDRVDFMNARSTSFENILAINKLKEALFWLQERQSSKSKRLSERKH